MRMKVTGLKTEAVDIEVNPSVVLDQIKDRWLQDMRGDRIWNGQWMRESGYGSHSWEEERGEATEVQLEIWKAFQTIQDVIKGFK